MPALRSCASAHVPLRVSATKPRFGGTDASGTGESAGVGGTDASAAVHQDIIFELSHLAFCVSRVLRVVLSP